MTLQVLYDTLYLRLSMGLALVIIHLNGDFPMDFPEPKTTQLWGYPRHGNLEAFLELGCPEPWAPATSKSKDATLFGYRVFHHQGLATVGFTWDYVGLCGWFLINLHVDDHFTISSPFNLHFLAGYRLFSDKAAWILALECGFNHLIKWGCNGGVMQHHFATDCWWFNVTNQERDVHQWWGGCFQCCLFRVLNHPVTDLFWGCKQPTSNRHVALCILEP